MSLQMVTGWRSGALEVLKSNTITDTPAKSLKETNHQGQTQEVAFFQIRQGAERKGGYP